MASNRPHRAPFRERFFSSMDYDEYCTYFSPPQPLLKPLPDPELIDGFELNPELTMLQQENNKTNTSESTIQNARVWGPLPTIPERRGEDDASNMPSQRINSPHMGFEIQQPIRPSLKRSHSRMRSRSEQVHLIFDFLDRADKILKKKSKKEEDF